jgi:hypothetical protein
VGTAFPNSDGSFNLFLDALPVNGRLHIREVAVSAKAKPEAPAPAAEEVAA